MSRAHLPDVEQRRRFDLFGRLVDALRMDDPPHLRDLAEVIARFHTLEPTVPRSRLRHAFVRKTGLQRLRHATRGQLALMASVAPRRSAVGDEVLVIAPFSRADYVALLAPVANAISSRGMLIAVVTSTTTARTWRANVDSNRVRIRPEPLLQRFQDRVIASKLAADDAPQLTEWLTRCGMDSSDVARGSLLLEAYWRDRLVMRNVLSTSQITAVVALHFVHHPGYLAAIREPVPGRVLPRIVLVQHGQFTRETGFHDFAGSDVLAVWADHWRTELDRYPKVAGYRLPKVVVTGNPKIESHTPAISTESPGSRKSSQRTILYIREARAPEAIDKLVAEATRDLPSVRCVVKPHPSEQRRPLLLRMSQLGFHRSMIAEPSDDTTRLISGALVVVGAGSTALLEAAALARPIIELREPGKGPRGGHELPVPKCESPHSLRKRLLELVSNTSESHRVALKQQSALEPFIGPRTGASANIAALVLHESI